jgi:hypothetical protein
MKTVQLKQQERLSKQQKVNLLYVIKIGVVESELS